MASTEDNGGHQAPWLLSRAGARLCAIPVAHVVEIMRLLPIEPVSGMPPFIRGVCIIRGSPLPVVDAGLIFGDQEIQAERLVTIRTGDRTIVLAVDQVLGLREIGTEVLEALPPLLREIGGDAISAIGTLDAELLLFLRTARIVPEAIFDGLVSQGAVA
jgi:purine-binding chemotaxis protein CheW